jgi:hypothetical protein
MPRLPYVWAERRKKVHNFKKTNRWYKEIKL